jgi:hypothetical protein
LKATTYTRKNLEESFQCEVECAEEVIYTAERIVENTEQVIEPTFSNMMTQTPVQPMFSVENFASDNMAMESIFSLNRRLGLLFGSRKNMWYSSRKQSGYSWFFP